MESCLTFAFHTDKLYVELIEHLALLRGRPLIRGSFELGEFNVTLINIYVLNFTYYILEVIMIRYLSTSICRHLLSDIITLILPLCTNCLLV